MDNNLTSIIKIGARLFSIALYPLFIPTYGSLLYLYTLKESGIALQRLYVWISLGGTIFLTIILPLSLIYTSIHVGLVKDIYMKERKERTLPYILCLLALGLWCKFIIGTLHVPVSIWLTAIGACVALALISIINLKWKVSSHLTSLGGLIGGIAGYSLFSGSIALELVAALLFVSLLLMYARIYEEAHTPLQTIVGLLLGITCTFIPNLILFYPHA